MARPCQARPGYKLEHGRSMLKFSDIYDIISHFGETILNNESFLTCFVYL